jgi:putative inorganic carbon (HCO3(-)) transporter
MQWADPIGVVLLSLVISLVPFVSNASVKLLLVTCASFWVLLTLTENEAQNSSSTPIHLLVLLYWGTATVATALSPVKKAAFFGWTTLTLYLMLFALMARLLRSPHLRSWLITLYLHIALIVSIYGIRQWFFGAPALATWVDPESSMANITRVYSYLGNPNLLAGYLIPAVAFSIVAIFAWRGWFPKTLALIMIVVNLMCLILTFSRGSWYGLVVSVFALLILLVHWWSVDLPRFWRTWTLLVVLGSVAGLLVLGVVFVAPISERAISMLAGRSDSSINFRINVWAAVREMILDRPIIGIGPGHDAFNKIYPLYQRTRFSALSAYSIFLETAVETGFIGLSCFLWLLLVTCSQGWLQLQQLRRLRSQEGFWLMGAISALLGLLGHGLVDTVWYRPQVSTLGWLMIALIASYYGSILTCKPSIRNC